MLDGYGWHFGEFTAEIIDIQHKANKRRDKTQDKFITNCF